MTNTRRPTIQQHSARPAPQAEGKSEEMMAYIDFVNKLMHRMRLDSLKRMLEAALKEIE